MKELVRLTTIDNAVPMHLKESLEEKFGKVATTEVKILQTTIDMVISIDNHAYENLHDEFTLWVEGYVAGNDKTIPT